MKGHPALPGMVELDIDQRFMDFFGYLKNQVERDKRDRWPWMEKVRRLHARRYALDKRKPTFPFPGSADIWPPYVDMVIEQMKALYLNLTLLSSPPVTAVALGDDEDDRTGDVELWFEYMLNKGSPNFMREQHYFVDDILSTGFGWLKTYWAYETRTAPETITSSSLPEELQARIVNPDANRQIANTLYLRERLFDQMAEKPAVIENTFHPSTRSLIEHSYDLDHTDRTDEKAIKQILAWMRSGAKEPLTIQKRDTVIDAPATSSIMGENLIVPSGATDVEDCFHITHEMWMEDFQIRARKQDGLWRPETVDQVIGAAKGMEDPRFVRTGIQAIEAQRQGMNWTRGDKSYILESCSWFDHDGDGVDSKVVVLWSPVAELPLKAYLYDRPSGRWPYHLCEFERNKRGIFASRGIPERLQDIEREMVVQKRAQLNRFMISSALSLMVRSTSPLANQAIKWVPGEKLIVNDVDRDAKPLVFPDLTVIFENMEQNLKVWGEDYTGTPNYAITDQPKGLERPRTAHEIEAIQSKGRSIGVARTSIYRECMSVVFEEMFAMFQMLGPKSVWVNTTATAPMELTKEMLQGSFNFLLGPLVGLDDPQLEAQKAVARIQLLTQIQQVPGLLPPEIKLDMGEAIKLWLRKDDPRAARKIIKRRSPEELQQMEQEAAQKDAFQGALLGIQHAQQMAPSGAMAS